jgi:hypothetical protein
MRASPILASLLFVLAVACDGGTGEPSLSGGKADALGGSAALTFVDPAAAEIVRQHVGAGNGEHRIGTYDVEGFDADEVLDAIRARDGATACDERVYSTSRADGVADYAGFTADDSFRQQIEDTDDPAAVAAIAAAMAALVGDPANLGVFSSLHDPDGHDDPVHCNTFDFYVFRADGTKILFGFDYSD